MQSKKESFKESLINTFLGFTISLAATFLVLPLFGIHSTILKTPTKETLLEFLIR